mmetsp:Transcript_47453/g.113881  ORF Transcript_47453/g.113881 Transcript_47453/m.113881 type:complete len:250 (+) Transcript_47453:68-817(+)
MAHLQCLGDPRITSLDIQEQANIMEAITAIIGQEVEMANKYKILANGEQIFFAVEQTDCCSRQLKQCLPDCAPWNLDILYTQGGASMQAFHLQRDFTCTICCLNRPVVNVTDVTTGQEIGSIQDPCACCDLTFAVRGPDGEDALKAKGGCCQWGLCCPLPCGPCAEVNFNIEDASSGEEVAHLKKKVPGCCKFLFAPDVDHFDVDLGGVQDPNYKALLMSLAIFMDFRYFNENKNDDSGGLMGAFAGAE